MRAPTNEILKLQDPLVVTGRVVTVDAWPTPTETAGYLVKDHPAHDVNRESDPGGRRHRGVAPADVAPSGPAGGPRPRPHGDPRHSNRDRGE